MNIKNAIILPLVGSIAATVMIGTAKADDGGWKAESINEEFAMANLRVAIDKLQNCDTVAECRRATKQVIDTLYTHEQALVDKQAAYTGFVVASDVAKTLEAAGHISAREVNHIESVYQQSAARAGVTITRK